MPEEKFKEWAIMDLFGHKRLAGEVSETNIAGGAFIRIDIPVGDNVVTQFYGPAAIYGLYPVTEETARAVASQCVTDPINRWDVQEAVKRLPNPQSSFDLDDEPF